jgi:hypothetical protein
MTSRTFFRGLAVLTAASVALLLGLARAWPALAQHQSFSLGVVLLFVLICTGLFFAGRAAGRSSDRFAFTNLVSISVFGKMALALALLFAYRGSAQPENALYVPLFLGIYVVYTAFEVWFMMRLAKTPN